MSSEDSDDVFLSLEDEEVEPAKTKSRWKPKIKSQPEAVKKEVVKAPPIIVEPVDMEVLGDYGGVHGISWPLLDMDCPDCASKAMKALNRLDQVGEVKVSATDGMVNVQVDFDKGDVAEVSTILKSLGNAPDLPHMEIRGVKAEAIANRHSISTKGLPRLFRRQPGVLDCEIDKDGRILLQVIPDMDSKLRQAQENSLKSVIGSTYQLSETKSTRISSAQWRLIGSGVAFIMFATLISFAILGIENMVAETIIGIIGVIAGGTRMFMQAIASLKNRQLGFQVLTSLAVLGASYLQHWDEALMVVILVAWTEHMEGDALTKSREAMQGGLDRLPRIARRVPDPKPKSLVISKEIKLDKAPVSTNSGPAIEEVPIDLIMKGDYLEIRSGELIPADGVIITGTGSINRAPLTGESVPVDVGTGDAIQAGLTLARGPVVMKVEASGEDTRLSGLIEAVHSFREQPTRVQGALENFTSVWVPLVLIGAMIAYFATPGADLKLIFLLWVVACPCALLLATPVPHAATLAKASRQGIIARGGDVLETLSKVNLALLDKTGTLTSGKPRIGEVVLARGRRREAAIALAAGIEVSSNHPYAQAVMTLAEDEGISFTSVSSITDGEKGVHGKISGASVSMVRAEEELVSGALANALASARKEGHGASLLLKDDKPVALFTFIHDDLRAGAEDLIKRLHSQGINVEMLSGDNQGAVDALAKSIGIPANAAHGEMTPEDKVSWVKGRSKTHVTMMVGDGFNDAAAMAAADIGIAIGSGEATNLDAADVLIPGNQTGLIADVLTQARKTSRVLIQNLAYSVAITFVLVYIVLADISDNLALMVLVHEVSVIGVIINGARLSGSGGTLPMIWEIIQGLYTETMASFSALFNRD